MEKMKARVMFDDDVESKDSSRPWYIEILSDDEYVPVGKVVANIGSDTQMFVITKFESREAAIEWIKSKGDLLELEMTREDREDEY